MASPSGLWQLQNFTPLPSLRMASSSPGVLGGAAGWVSLLLNISFALIQIFEYITVIERGLTV